MTSNSSARRFQLEEIPGRYAICTLAADAPIPTWADGPGFVSISRTPDELSVVCSADRVPEAVVCDAGWACLQVQGPFSFDTIGVLAALSAALAQDGISLFAVSTYQTDYLLVKQERFADAAAALRRAGHEVTRSLPRS
jgi:hypothetical protein